MSTEKLPLLHSNHKHYWNNHFELCINSNNPREIGMISKAEWGNFLQQKKQQLSVSCLNGTSRNYVLFLDVNSSNICCGVGEDTKISAFFEPQFDEPDTKEPDKLSTKLSNSLTSAFSSSCALRKNIVDKGHPALRTDEIPSNPQYYSRFEKYSIRFLVTAGWITCAPCIIATILCLTPNQLSD